jgi:hypothetical protein
MENLSLEKPQKSNATGQSNIAEQARERQSVSLENYDILKIKNILRLLENKKQEVYF